MDSDGALHNLRPIGRLETSGPDVEPRRYADTAFGGGWFVAKASDKPTGADGQGSTTGDGGRLGADDGEATASGVPGAAVTDGSTVDGSTVDGKAGSGKAEGADATDGKATDGKATDGKAGDGTGNDGTDGADNTAGGNGGDAAHRETAGGTTTGDAADGRATDGDGQAANGKATGQTGADGRNGTATGASRGGRHASAADDDVEETAPQARAEAKPDVPRGPELAPHLPLTATELSAIRWRLDGATLREVVDNRDALRALGERLDGPLTDEADNIVKAGLLSVRAEVYRLLGELGMAAAASRLALAHAESAQDLQSMVIAQAELAHVLRLRGDYLEADRLFQKAVEADVSPAVRSVVHENAGRSCFDQGRNMEALDHFARAIRLGAPEDTDLVERIGVCLEAVYIHVLRDGWGPYPRRSPEILTPLGGKPAGDGDQG